MLNKNTLRYPAVAGSFYPQDKEELRVMLEGLFKNTGPLDGISNLKALIVPHAGYVYSGTTAAWGYKQISNMKNQISKSKNYLKSDFVIIGPTHNFYFDGIVGNDFRWWETPLGRVRHNPPVNPGIKISSETFIPEHCLEVQLPFLQYLAGDFSVSCF